MSMWIPELKSKRMKVRKKTVLINKLFRYSMKIIPFDVELFCSVSGRFLTVHRVFCSHSVIQLVQVIT